MNRDTKNLGERTLAASLAGCICLAALGLQTGIRPVSAADAPATGNPAPVQQLPQVVIVGNTPLQDFGLPLNEVSSDVQTATSADLQREQSLDVVDYLNNNFSGLNVSEGDGNPFQIDLYYHGFTASPLLGTPEGLSVYVDGVRVNESFGDTVNWDLIPESAINSVSLISGSNPVFGLNTLGGAISIQTKNGRDDPGSEIEAYDGSFGRRSLEAETGGTFGPFDYFLTGNYYDDTGWRDLGSSRVWQGFGKVGWQSSSTHVDLSYTYADDFLWGDGATPLSMLSYLREQAYTPDYTQNLMHFVNLTGTQILADHLLLSGNVFYRYVNTSALNGNVNDFYLEDNYAGPPTDCTDSGADPATLAYCAPAQDATSSLTQRSKGFGLQLTDSAALLGWQNQGVIGIDYDDSRDGFYELSQYGGIAQNHQLVYEPSPYNDFPLVSVGGSDKILGAYFTDTLSPSSLLHLTVAGRYNRNNETIGGTSVDADPGDYGAGFLSASPVSGDHTFTRLNPSIGFTLTPTLNTTYYANYNEASRAPTVIELGCADPTEPCGLPDDFAADPNLEQVVARTFEIGLRGNVADRSFNWSADVFHTVNNNDIQFVATSINAGFFSNVGNTRREGLDIAFGGREAGFTWKLAYSYVLATFESSFVVNAPSNSTADADGNIQVQPGDRMPLVPEHNGRLILDYQLNEHLDVGASLIGVSGSYLHGNENNANVGGTMDAATGAYTSPDGTGWIPSYMELNFNGTYRFNAHFEIFGRMTNALDRDYATAGFLTQNVYTLNGTFKSDPDDWTNENNVVPGAPRTIWGGVRVKF
ncbi:MAG: TonB-dependent receptor [Steroidobacteraceae bacterium]